RFSAKRLALRSRFRGFPAFERSQKGIGLCENIARSAGTPRKWREIAPSKLAPVELAASRS
ncbi:MAG: hypothetical protein ACRC33_02370, partial [Gemmataceae bacterium]